MTRWPLVALAAALAAQPLPDLPTPHKVVSFFSPDDPAVPRALAAAGLTAPGGWTGTSRGLWRVTGSRREYFASRRYLPDDDVRAVLAGSDAVWVRTATGVARIEFRPMTLAEKAAYFEERIEARHVRHGMVADSVFRAPGDPASNQTVSSDNDGLWTAIYGAAQCYRYAVTKSPEALARATRAIEAVLYLEQITGIPGFPARSYIRPGEPQPADGFWHGEDPRWKGDTSSDEIVGHFYLFWAAHELLPDGPLRQRVRETAARIMDHIVRNGWYLIDVTGKPTRWGRWSPEYFASKTGYPDSPLNAVELLMFLKVTRHLTGDARWDREYRRVAYGMGYARIAAEYRKRREELNYSDEELAMLSFAPLVSLEKDPALLARYREAMRQWWTNIVRDRNPLWIYIYKLANPPARVDLAAARETLQRIPLDLIKWTITNSHREDVRMAAAKDRHGRPEALTWLPPDERPVMKWNGNPFVVDGGNGGRGEDDGAFFLLPYWLGRHAGFLQ
jgi:hypothetical protein